MTRNENLVPLSGVHAGKRFRLVFEGAICRTSRDYAVSLRAWLGSYLQSNLLKDSHSIEPWTRFQINELLCISEASTRFNRAS